MLADLFNSSAPRLLRKSHYGSQGRPALDFAHFDGTISSHKREQWIARTHLFEGLG